MMRVASVRLLAIAKARQMSLGNRTRKGMPAKCRQSRLDHGGDLFANHSQRAKRSQFCRSILLNVMSSLKQIAANRRNALRSTGPTSEDGKARSRCNALRHGLTAETLIAGLEDAEDYQAFEATITAEYEAETAIERELVLRLASVLWRLRRATGIESALFECANNSLDGTQSEKSPRVLVELGGGPDGKQLKLVKTDQHDLVPVDAPIRDVKGEIGARFLRLADLASFPLDRLSRYEHLLWRQAKQIMFTLETLRRRRSSPRRSSFPFSFRRREPSLADES
jgi:hypothetical protein